MMAKLNRQLMVSCSLAAGLLLASAPAVFAADPPAGAPAGGSATGQSNSADGRATAAENSATGQATAADNQSSTGQSHSAAGQGTAADNQANAADNQANAADNQANAADNQANAGNNNPGGGNPGNNNPGGGNPGQAQGNQGAAKTAPPGNNGTIKVDMNGDTTTRNNEPQGDCQGVTIKFFNFDPSETISVTFSGQAPTPFPATAAVTVDAHPLTGNAARSFSLAQMGIVQGVTPTAPNGGWHVRVEANGLNHPAGVKTKVFWLRCETPPVTPTVGGTETNQAAVAGTQQVQNQGAATTATPPTPRRLEVAGVLLERSPSARVAGTQQARVAASPAAAGVNDAARARVLGTTVERSALARTGLDAMQLATLGALALLAGYAALRVSRRKSAPGSHFVI